MGNREPHPVLYSSSWNASYLLSGCPTFRPLERDMGLKPISLAWKARAQSIYQSRNFGGEPGNRTPKCAMQRRQFTVSLVPQLFYYYIAFLPTMQDISYIVGPLPSRNPTVPPRSTIRLSRFSNSTGRKSICSTLTQT